MHVTGSFYVVVCTYFSHMILKEDDVVFLQHPSESIINENVELSLAESIQVKRRIKLSRAEYLVGLSTFE